MQRRIVVLVGSTPTLGFSYCVREGDMFVTSVRKTYYGPAAMPLKMTWTTPNKTVVNSTLTVNSTTTFSTINITVTPSTGPYFNCTMHFGPPTSVVVRGTIQATNAPTFVESVIVSILREY